jgi:hypothetical protein
LHRATVYQYIMTIQGLALPPDATPEMVRAALTALVPANHKPTPASAVLEPYAEEIKELITRRSDPLKAKSAWVRLIRA